jgi:hypothetical protein
VPLKQMPFSRVFGIKDPAGQPLYVLELARDRPSGPCNDEVRHQRSLDHGACRVASQGILYHLWSLVYAHDQVPTTY